MIDKSILTQVTSKICLAVCVVTVLMGCNTQNIHQAPKANFINEKTAIYLAADSTVADHTLNDDYWENRHPVTGWGQKFEEQFAGENASRVSGWISPAGVQVFNKARGGRSTRTFFEEGRWREIIQAVKPHDIVMIQFGHNDQAVEKTERYVTVQGYKEYLRLFITQTREKGAVPILLTPVNRNYPWENGKLGNSHGDYPQAAREVAMETGVAFIDLGLISREYYASIGQEKVTHDYFMNLPKGKFSAYPNGNTDNTHFQPEGAAAIAKLVFEAMTQLKK